eukprot:jgi/Ulvmu1/8487/UM044_0021.1
MCASAIMAWFAIAFTALAAGPVTAFYLPGVAPKDYSKGQPISGLKVNKLSSSKTQLPYEYYSLPYCTPDKIISSAENLGEVLRGDRIVNSKYELSMGVDEQCKVLCRIESLTEAQAKAFRTRIEEEYRVNMILDNLPVAIAIMQDPINPDDPEDQGVKTYERGFPVGYVSAVEENAEPKVFINNHLRFTVLHNYNPETDLSRIVGFEVEEYSVKHRYEGAFPPEGTDAQAPPLTTCNANRMSYVTKNNEPQMVQEGEEVIFTYDILFQKSPIRWASRWDTYLLMHDEPIHWFSIINSLMIVVFLTGMVAMIMLRTLHRDIAKYNQLESAEEAQEETGWKLVHGDVFRPPPRSSLLATYVGTGVQLLGMSIVTMVFAVLGFLSPANRGGLMSAMLLLFVFMGVCGGYAAGRMYRQVRGEAWRIMTLRTALMFPGVASGVFMLLNLLVWGEQSSGAVPFSTLFALSFLWFGVSVPLVFTGSYFGFKRAPVDDPVRTNKIPRQVPDQPWYMHPVFSCLVGGILPFGAVFIELYFILTSMWLHTFYYIFGFLAMVFLIVFITCIEISIVLCYFQLCSEDYRWWWRSYFTSGSSALYLFLYSAFYFYTKLDITKTVPMLMYFGYMLMISYGFFCITGTIGFYACHWFVKTIYGAVKID